MYITSDAVRHLAINKSPLFEHAIKWQIKLGAVINNCNSCFACPPESRNAVKQIIDAISARYSFLWMDDARNNFAEILSHDGPKGALHAVKREADRLAGIEHQVGAMLPKVGVGAVCLYMQPVRETLIGLAVAWKNLYTSALLERAQV